MAETKTAGTASASSLYEQDLVRWTQVMSAALRTRDIGALDWDNLAEEIESLGGRDRRELKSRLTVLIAHLLKWQFQPELRETRTWRATIRKQRHAIADLLEQSPSLKPAMAETWATTFRRALAYAADEIRAARSLLPATCPYTQDQVLEQNFLPE